MISWACMMMGCRLCPGPRNTVTSSFPPCHCYNPCWPRYMLILLAAGADKNAAVLVVTLDRGRTRAEGNVGNAGQRQLNRSQQKPPSTQRHPSTTCALNRRDLSDPSLGELELSLNTKTNHPDALSALSQWHSVSSGRSNGIPKSRPHPPHSSMACCIPNPII